MEKKTVDVLVDGGQATAGPPLGPTLGPIGLNVLEVVKKINELTADYSGMKVPVKILIDIETKTFEISVGTPTTAALIVKELGITKGSGSPKIQKVGNLTIEQLIRVAKLKSKQLLSKNLKAAIKEVIGSCVSLGVNIEGKEAKQFQEEINKGVYNEYLLKQMNFS